MADQQIDPAIYGARPLDAHPEFQPGQPGSNSYVPPTAVPEVNAVRRSSLVGEGAMNILRDNEAPATTLESIGAAMSQWTPVHLHEYFTQPKFDWATGHNPVRMMGQVDFPLDKDQEKFLLETKSPEEFHYRVEKMKEQNLAYRAMADNGATSFAIAALDPGYLAIDAASLGVGRLTQLAGASARVARLAAGGTAAGGAVAIGKAEQQVQPLSDSMVFVNAMMNGAATSAFFRGGEMHVRDAEFPSNALHDVVHDIQARADGTAEVSAVKQEEAAVTRNSGKGFEDGGAIKADPVAVDAVAVDMPKVADPVAGEVPVRTVNRRPDPTFPFTVHSGREVLRGIEAGSDELLSTMARRVNELLVDDVEVRKAAKSNLLGGARPYYDPAQHIVYISKDTPPHIQLHEMAHALTAHKIAYGEANPLSAHGKIVSEMKQTLEVARAAYKDAGGSLTDKTQSAYFLKNLDEFVAGVFSGKSNFLDQMAKLPVVAGAQRSVLGSMVDSIRRILGMAPQEVNALTHMVGLTEALAHEKLHVTMFQGKAHLGADVSSGMSFRLAPPDLGPQSLPQAQRSIAQAIGKKIEWSLHKTLAKFSPEAQRIADLLVDDPLTMVGDSVVSQHRAIRADLQRTQAAFENLLADHMASQGAGLMKRIVAPRESLALQRGIERDVYMEMLRRNRLSVDGMPIDHTNVPAHIKGMADALDVVGRQALGELKRSGVFGAENLVEHSGYINRRWDISKIEAIEQRLVHDGMSLADARMHLRDTMSVAIQRTNGWDAELASDVSKAILDRARSKGYFEDAAFRRAAGGESLAEVRNLLTGSGIPEARMQRVLDVLAGRTDEAGKASMMKHRIDMDLSESISHADGSTSTLADMLDTNVMSTTERYLDNVSSQAAFARKGLTKSSDITKLRSELLESIPNANTREQAMRLFDNTIASLQGHPVGEELPDFMRKAQAVTQMVGLARAGLFQFTEYSTAMAQYGGGRAVAEMFKELPVLRTILSDPKEATHLRNVLAGNASSDLRMRPFISRLEDNFEIPVGDSIHMGLMQAKQLVPYLNGLKFVQGHQSRVVGNLIVNTFQRAANGDVKALAALEHYGLESHIMGQVRSDIAAHGMDTAKWAASTWDSVRGPLNKMMDDAVLRNRTGEIPAFAQFTSTGKFIFTFRSFVLGAHNKVLAGSLNRGGFGGLGLLMMYQFPMTFAVTAASNAISGKKPQTDKQNIGEAFSQMGSLGLFSEAVGVALQNKQQFGSPGTIAIDHVYKLGAAAATGSGKATAAAGLSMVPLLSVILPIKAIGENLKGK